MKSLLFSPTYVVVISFCKHFVGRISCDWEGILMEFTRLSHPKYLLSLRKCSSAILCNIWCLKQLLVAFCSQILWDWDEVSHRVIQTNQCLTGNEVLAFCSTYDVYISFYKLFAARFHVMWMDFFHWSDLIESSKLISVWQKMKFWHFIQLMVFVAVL